jgi:hypothetical protein
MGSPWTSCTFMGRDVPRDQEVAAPRLKRENATLALVGTETDERATGQYSVNDT